MNTNLSFFRVVSVFLALSVGGYASEKLKLNCKNCNYKEIKQNVERIVAAGQANLHAKGVEGILTIGGEEVVNKGFGIATTEMTARKNAHFRLGVPTLTFTETWLLQLVDRGEISLDDKLSKWYPNLPNADLITIRMLGNSTTGYFNYSLTADVMASFNADPFQQWDPEQLIAIGTSQPLVFFPPGSNWSFSHTNFVILGQILQKVTGIPVNQAIKEYILDPLNLKETKYNINSVIPTPVLHAYTPERGFYEDNTYWNPTLFPYAGSMTSTIGDLGKWVRVLGRGELISKQSYANFVAPTTANLASFTPNLYFGLGALVDNGWIILNPNFDGYTGVFGYLPSLDLSIVIYNTISVGISNTVNLSQIIFFQILDYLNTIQTVPIPVLP